MARNITLNLSLLSVACKTDPATIRRESMSNLCLGQPGKAAHDATPLTMPKTCAHCGPITDFAALKKGIKQGSTYAVVTQEEVAEAKKDTSEQFKGKIDLVPHPAADFLTATGQGKALNYITPATGSEDHYQLLVKIVEDHPELVFAGQHTPSSAVGLFRLAVRDGVLLMEERTREQSMKPTPTVSGSLNQPLYDLLEATLDKMVQPYDPDTYEDTYAIAVAQMAIDAQDTVSVGTAGPKTTTTATVPASDADLMAKLKALSEA